MLPMNFAIYGFARSKMSDQEFRDYIGNSLTCRLSDKEKCGDKMGDFLDRCFYQPGQYKDEADFSKLAERMTDFEGVITMPITC